jgi:hypothetical protein
MSGVVRRGIAPSLPSPWTVRGTRHNARAQGGSGDACRSGRAAAAGTAKDTPARIAIAVTFPRRLDGQTLTAIPKRSLTRPEPTGRRSLGTSRTSSGVIPEHWPRRVLTVRQVVSRAPTACVGAARPRRYRSSRSASSISSPIRSSTCRSDPIVVKPHFSSTRIEPTLLRATYA